MSVGRSGTRTSAGERRQLGIVYIADVPQIGGASASLFDLVTRMSSEHGATCTVLMPTHGPLKDKLDDAGIRTIVTGHRAFLVSRPATPYKMAPKYARDLVRYLAGRQIALRKAEAEIDFANVDIIHSNLPRNDLGMDLARRHGKPHVCHLREFSFEDFGCWSYRERPAEYLDSGTDAFIAVSRACGDAWVERGVDPAKAHVVYDGIDTSRFQRRKARPADGMLRLVFLGGYSNSKGVWDALHAMTALPPELAASVSLDVFGYGSPSVKRKARRFLADNGLEHRVSLFGPVEDVPSLLPSYDCGLVCSRCEAFGRIVIEYQAAGLTVIGANAGSLPELLRNGSQGVLYDKATGALSLSVAISALAKEPEVLATLKKRSRSYAETFSIEKTVSGVRSVYAEVLEAATRGE